MFYFRSPRVGGKVSRTSFAVNKSDPSCIWQSICCIIWKKNPFLPALSLFVTPLFPVVLYTLIMYSFWISFPRLTMPVPFISALIWSSFHGQMRSGSI